MDRPRPRIDRFQDEHRQSTTIGTISPYIRHLAPNTEILAQNDQRPVRRLTIHWTAEAQIDQAIFPVENTRRLMADARIRADHAIRNIRAGVFKVHQPPVKGGGVTVVRSKTDAEAQGTVVAITPAAMEALNAIRPAGVDGSEKVFGWSESQIARRVKAIAKAAGLADWEFFIGHSGRVGMALRMAQSGAPTHEIERQGRWKQGAGMVGRYTRGETAGSALRYL